VVVQVDIHGPESFRRWYVCQAWLVGLLGQHPDFFYIVLSVLEGIGATAGSL
jgi:hypothetical protein